MRSSRWWILVEIDNMLSYSPGCAQSGVKEEGGGCEKRRGEESHCGEEVCDGRRIMYGGTLKV